MAFSKQIPIRVFGIILLGLLSALAVVLVLDQRQEDPANDPVATPEAQPSDTRSSIDQVPVIVLDSPPFPQGPPEVGEATIRPITLTLLSSIPNQITDEDAWFTRHQLSLPRYPVPHPSQQLSGELPNAIPTQYQDALLIQALPQPTMTLLFYGKNFSEARYLFSYHEQLNRFNYGYDFENYWLSPDDKPEEQEFVQQQLIWAIQETEILYVSIAHATYAESSNGMNAYLTAINTDTHERLWRSQSLVCNAENFVIIENAIICGYGFTAEPDYLYLLDKATGSILDQISVASAPKYILQKGSELYVRTYNTDYVFSIDR